MTEAQMAFKGKIGDLISESEGLTAAEVAEILALSAGYVIGRATEDPHEIHSCVGFCTESARIGARLGLGMSS